MFLLREIQEDDIPTTKIITTEVQNLARFKGGL